MNLPLVDILIRTIGRPTLETAIEAAHAQTYANCRVVILDDTEGIAEPHNLRGDEYMVMPERPFGYGHLAFEWWIHHAEVAPFVKILDDDDWMHPRTVETMMRPMLADEKVDLVSCQMLALIDLPGSPMRSRIVSGMLANSHIGYGSMLIRTKRAKLVPPIRQYPEDYHWARAFVGDRQREAFRTIHLPLYVANFSKTVAERVCQSEMTKMAT